MAYETDTFVSAQDGLVLTGMTGDHPVNPKVQNGRAYDKAVLEMKPDSILVVPTNARVEFDSAGPHVVQLFMEKCLSFGGHPPKPMSIRLARKYMGCARHEETGGITIATYGEWGSKEGGTELRLLVRVPSGTRVQTRPDLSGEHSAGESWETTTAGEPDVPEGWWYGPASPAKGWKPIPSTPDPQMVAK
jgi:hypothetical protein